MFILLFIFSSCHKEEIIIDKKDVIDPPVEINNALFSGRIIHDNNGVAGADIYIYQNGEKLGKVVSDQDGYYSTKDFELEIGKDVTFEIKTKEYLTKIRRESSDKIIYKNKNFVLYSSFSGAFDYNLPEDPGDTNLVKIYGTLVDENGTYLQNIGCNSIWNVKKITPNEYTADGASDITDENGYFEILVPKYVYMYFFSFSKDSECPQFININDVDTILFDFPLQEIGELVSDFEVFSKKNFVLNQVSVDLNGQFQDCSGIPINKGDVDITINTINSFNHIIYSHAIHTKIDNDGNFNISTKLCKENRLKIEVLVTNDTYNNRLGQYKEFTYQNEMINAGVFMACDDYNLYDNKLKNFRIGNLYSIESQNVLKEYSHKMNFTKRKNIEKGIDFKGSASVYPSQKIIKSFIRITDIKIGINNIDYFEIGMNRPWGFRAENGELIANVSKIENDFIYGTIEGEVETNGLGKQTITGDFQFHL